MRLTVRILIPGREESFPRYAAAVRQAGGEPVFGREAAECGGLLLPGGGDICPALYGQPNRGSDSWDEERDGLELELTERFLRLGRPILGICRGLQVVNVALGGSLAQHIDGHSRREGRDSRHVVEAEPGSLAERLWGGRFTVNSAHHQAADRPGAGLRVTARAEDGTAEALEHETLPVWAVQWHPERLPPELGDGGALFRYFLARCEKERPSR